MDESRKLEERWARPTDDECGWKPIRPKRVDSLTGTVIEKDPLTGLRIDIDQEAYTFKKISPEEQREVIKKEFKDAKCQLHFEKAIDQGCPILNDPEKIYKKVYTDGFAQDIDIKESKELDYILTQIEKKHAIKTTWTDGKLTINGAVTKITKTQILNKMVTQLSEQISVLFI